MSTAYIVMGAAGKYDLREDWIAGVYTTWEAACAAAEHQVEVDRANGTDDSNYTVTYVTMDQAGRWDFWP